MPETSDFLRVHSLFVSILERELGGELPLPAEVRPLAAGEPFESAAQLQKAHVWLTLLNLALTPPLFRTGVQRENPDEATIRAVIRYLAANAPQTETDRDRLDWLLTWAFKRADTAGAGTPFNAIRQRILGWLEGIPQLPLSDAAQDLLAQGAAAIEEIGEFRSFDQLSESRLIQRGRELKENLKHEFFHPEVLPAIVNYNLVFGKRFDQLFAEAARQARELAAGIAEKDYRTTGGDFRKLSEAVRQEQRKPAPAPGLTAEATPAPAPVLKAEQPEPQPAPLPEDPAARMKALGIDAAWQEMQLNRQVAEIGLFVRSAGRTVRAIPLPHGNLPVSDWESAPFNVDYPASEATFRAEFARAIQNAVGCMARIQEELALYQEKRSSTEYLWKAHYDALVFLFEHGRELVAKLERLAVETKQRGLLEKADNLTKTVEKLRGYIEQAAAVL